MNPIKSQETRQSHKEPPSPKSYNEDKDEKGEREREKRRTLKKEQKRSGGLD